MVDPRSERVCQIQVPRRSKKVIKSCFMQPRGALYANAGVSHYRFQFSFFYCYFHADPIPQSPFDGAS